MTSRKELRIVLRLMVRYGISYGEDVPPMDAMKRKWLRRQRYIGLKRMTLIHKIQTGRIAIL